MSLPALNHKRLLLALALAAAAGASALALSRHESDNAQARLQSPIVAEVRLAFEDKAGGYVIVSDADSHKQLAAFEPGNGAFVRGVMRGLVRERRMDEDSSRAPFVLSQRRDGSVWLQDEVTGRIVALNAFGSVNAAQFATFIAKDRRMP